MRVAKLGTARVPVVGIGTWNMEADDRASCIAAIHRSIDLGASHVDTAEMYGNGVVEELVGDAIAGRRDDVYLVSKVLPENASRTGTIAACERSLRRLRAERLDLYLLHWRGPHPLAGTIEAFETLVSQGKIAQWGVSNFDEADLAEAWALSKNVACNQVLHHLKERAIEHAVLPWCEQHGVAVVSYSPFGSGDFPRSKTLTDVAAAHDVTPHAVALAFLARRTLVIPKSSTPSHVEANAAAGTLKLRPKELAALDEAFPVGPKPRDLPTI